MAINHYIEARANNKAVGACLTSRQWSKAAQLVETLKDADSARPHLLALARHHEEGGNHALAERFFVDADAPQLAVEMYTKVTYTRQSGQCAVGRDAIRSSRRCCDCCRCCCF